MAYTTAGDETVPLPSLTNLFCQVIPHVGLTHTHTQTRTQTHISRAQMQTHREGAWGGWDGMVRGKEVCIKNTHAKKKELHAQQTLGKLPVTLSYSICLFKTTGNYQGNALL